MHSQLPLPREGKNISSTSFAVSTSIADPSISIYKIEIQGDSDPVPPSKLEAKKMTGNPSDTQKGKTLALCHAILPPSERCNRLPVRCYMARAHSHYIQKNRVDHTPLHPARDSRLHSSVLPSSFWEKMEKYTCQAMPGPRIPVHRSSCMLLHHITEIATTYFQVFQT